MRVARSIVSFVVGALGRIVSRARRQDASAEPRLPVGAEAALWSILEAVPDPRNHLALVRDLSGEVRITDVERAMLATAYENREPEPASGARRSEAQPSAVPGREVVLDVRDPAPPAMDPYYDLGEIAENGPLTDHLFTPSRPSSPPPD
jgi:hypothetical protein